MKKMGKNMVAQVPKLKNNTCPEPQYNKIDIVRIRHPIYL